MNVKVLGIVTVALIGIAIFVSIRDSGPEAADDGLGSPLFPELSSRINEVARVEVVTPDGAFELAREADAWGMPSKGGYPVDFGKVKQLVVAIAELETLEKKTRTPAKFDALGVEDVDAPDAESTLVRLATKEGNELAALIIGDPRQAGRGGRPSLYVRKPGEDQSWLVNGRVFVEPEPTWLEKTVAEIGFERMQSVTTTHADGEVLRITRETPEDKEFSLEDLPEERALRFAGVASGIARGLQRLMLEDVQPASEVDFDQGPITVTEYATWDGLRVTVRTLRRAADEGEKSLLRLSAAYDESLRYEPVGPPLDQDDEAAAEPEPVGKTVDEVRAEVAQLEERWSPWVYIVPAYTGSNYFEKRVEDLLKPLSDPNQPPIGGDAGSPFGDLEGMGGLTLEDIFPDGLPEDLQGVDLGISPPVDDPEGIVDDVGDVPAADIDPDSSPDQDAEGGGEADHEHADDPPRSTEDGSDGAR